MEENKNNPIFKLIDRNQLEALISKYPQIDIKSYPKIREGQINSKAINKNNKTRR